MKHLIQRVQDILLRPQPTWVQIEQEPADTASLYKRYLVFLAAIPAVAGFIGMSLIGISGFGVHMRMPLLWGLSNMVLSYVLSLVMVFVLALIVDALAPSFGGTKSQINALKLVAYGLTASFVAGAFSLVPMLGTLGLIAGLYSIYLLYLGLPVLMKCPQPQAAGYTAVVVVCGIVAALLIGWVSALLTPSFGYGSKARFGGRSGEISRDATQAGDAGKAMAEVMGAIGSGEPFAAQDLKAVLPESAGGLQRESIEAQSIAGLRMSTAHATYAAGDKRLQLSVSDLGGMAGLAAMAGWINTTLDRETTDSVERVSKQGARTVREQYRKDGSSGEYTVLLANGVLVEAKGRRIDQPELQALVEALALDKLEARKRAPKPPE